MILFTPVKVIIVLRDLHGRFKLSKYRIYRTFSQNIGLFSKYRIYRTNGMTVFKMVLMVWKCVHGVAPAFLSDLCISTTAISGRQHLRSAASGTLQPLFRYNCIGAENLGTADVLVTPYNPHGQQSFAVNQGRHSHRSWGGMTPHFSRQRGTGRT